MAEHAPGGPPEMGAEMDYPEHQKTYAMFTWLIKACVILTAATLISMAFGFFTTAGFISSGILFLILCAIGFYATR